MNNFNQESRKHAERLIELSEYDVVKLTPKQITELLHELAEHQLELIRQNEALQQSKTNPENDQTKTELDSDRFFQLFDMSPISYLTLDSKGIIRDCNQAFTTLIAQDRQHLLGRHLVELIDINSRGLFELQFNNVLQHAQRCSVELALLDQSAATIFVSLSAQVLSNTTQYLEIFVTLIDISEIKETERALKNSEQLLRESQQAANIGSYTYSLANNTWECTPILNEILGISDTGSHTTTNWIELLHPDFSQKMELYFREVILNKMPFDAEYKIIRPCDGTERWIHGLGKIVYDQNGSATALLGTVSDITERKRNEQHSERLMHFYADLSGIREAILYADNEDQLLERICRIPVDSGLMSLVWIGFEDPINQRIVPTYKFGEGVEYLDDIVISTQEQLPEGRGTSGTAWRTEKPAITQNTKNNIGMAFWLKRGKRFAWQSCASFPIFRNKHIYAILSVYNREPNVFDEIIVNLLNALAKDVSFALDSLDARRLLIESEARNQALIGAIPDLIFLNTLDGEYLLAHSADQSKFYVPPSSFLHSKIDQILPPAIATQFLLAFVNASASGRVQELNYALSLKGQECFFEARIMPCGNAQFLTIIRDITQQKKIEAELEAYSLHLEYMVDERTQDLEVANRQIRLSEERYALALNATQDGLWDWNTQTNTCYYSPTYLRMLGYDYEATHINQLSFFTERLHPEELAEVMAAVDNQLLKQGSYEKEFRMRCKDQHYIWIMSRGKLAERDPQGNPLRAVGTHTDISKQKHLEIALRSANHEQQTIFDAASCGIVLLKDRVVLRCNKKFEEIFGYAPGELNGQSTRILYADENTYLSSGKSSYRGLSHGKISRHEQQMLRKDGSLFWVRIQAKLMDGDNLADGVVGIIEDITIERAATEALKNAKEMAEAAAFVKANFLANMSHEIRTPMNAVLGFCNLLKQQPLEANAAQLVSKIHDAGRSLLVIINDILDFSKIEAGKLPIEHARFNMTEILHDLASIMQDAAHKKNLQLMIKQSKVVGEVIGDRQRIQQVLINLLSNAIKFTEQGEVELGINIVNEYQDSVHLRFLVRDTGIGIAPEQQSEIFSAFTQADNSISRRYGGTGLGLAISRQLVQLMGGTLEMSSKVGTGSEFIVSQINNILPEFE